jgi:signal transduction histidine kinase/CheY-like chemotaxis protein
MFRKLEQSLRTSTMLVKELQEQILRREETQAQLHRTEEQLHHAQKMEAIGRLAGGIAHDFNNTLTVILGQTEVLQHSLRHDEDLLEAAKDIELAALRAAQLTRQLLVFSRRDVTRFQWVDPNATTRETVRVIRRLLGAQVQVETRLARDLPGLIVDEAQLQNAILNLAINARDAMPRGGRLAIEARNALLTEAGARELGGVPPGEYVTLTVRDSGVGMSEEERSRVFEPFYTTKPAGSGTGLGMAITYGIIQGHHGDIAVESALGQGTKFTITLPLLQPDETPPADIFNAGEGNLVLVVDDDAMVRRTTTATLTELGYNVVEAPGGATAVEIMRARPDRFSVVLLDLVMPGMTGSETFRALTSIRPDIPVVVCTGYAADSHIDIDVKRRIAGLVQKPFTAERLSRALLAAGAQPTRPARI